MKWIDWNLICFCFCLDFRSVRMKLFFFVNSRTVFWIFDWRKINFCFSKRKKIFTFAWCFCISKTKFRRIKQWIFFDSVFEQNWKKNQMISWNNFQKIKNNSRATKIRKQFSNFFENKIRDFVDHKKMFSENAESNDRVNIAFFFDNFSHIRIFFRQSTFVHYTFFNFAQLRVIREFIRV